MIADVAVLAGAGFQLFVAGMIVGRHGWSWGVLLNFAMAVILTGMVMRWWTDNALLVMVAVVAPVFLWMLWDLRRANKAIERDLEFAAIVTADADRDDG